MREKISANLNEVTKKMLKQKADKANMTLNGCMEAICISKLVSD